MARRILHVLWSLEIGGAERALYQLIAEQRRRGIEADAAVAAGLGLYGELVRETGATVHELHQRRAADAGVARRARAVFGQYDVVHFHSAEPFLAGIAATVAARRYYTHRAGAVTYPIKQATRYRLTGVVLRRAFTRLSANTHHAAKAASALFRLPVSAIQTTYNGIDFELLRPSRTREAVQRELGNGPVFRVASTANLRAIKRIDLLLRAVAGAEADTHCYVIGDGPDLGRLEELTKTLAISDRVRFLGKSENVVDYLQVMDAFVLPTGPEESFGNAAVEAMALGLPTAVFRDGGGLLEHVIDRETGFVVRDWNELADVLSKLARERDYGARIGAAGAASVRKRYSLANMIDSYEALYSNAVSPR